MEILLQELVDLKVPIRLNTVVRTIDWSRGKVRVEGHTSEKNFAFEAWRALITVPLGVLQARPRQAGSIMFTPDLPASKQAALKKLEMGHVIRITLQFRRRFWEKIHPIPGKKSQTLSQLSFLFSDDEWFPTWWTKMPADSPVITGWAPFKSADYLSGQDRRFIVDKAVTALSIAMQVPKQKVTKLLKQASFHDWQSDPFSRGAYSYVKVGGTKAPSILSKPVKRTLYFAGEATEPTGQTGTVHGAMATGKRAAQEIMGHLKSDGF